MPKAKRIHIEKISLPRYARETTHVIVGDKILFITIDHDSDAANPCKEWDGFGSIRSLSRKHVENIDPDEALEILKTDPDAVALSYFEHGNSLWMVKDSTAPAGVEFRWDGVRFAGVWIPDQCVRESYTGQDGLTRRDWMVKQAAAACETYSQWCNGEVYGYSVEAFKARLDDDGEPFDALDDYRRDEPIFDDSCWGFYGWDSIESEVKGVVKNALSELGLSKRALAAIATLVA